MEAKPVYLYFENGMHLTAQSFGAEGESVGEIVFNTSLTGYEEIITDPSYAGQFITFTATEIGNVGINEADKESRGVYCTGVIIKNHQSRPSNFRSEESLDAFLKSKNIMGICDIDTRYLTKMLRNEGAMMMIASTEESNPEVLKAKLAASPRIEEINYIEHVSTQESYTYPQAAWNHLKMAFDAPQEERKRIVAFDFGAKLNILNELTAVGLEVEVVPYNTNADALIERFKQGEISGVFLSNGPGDPLVLKDVVTEVKKLINENIPMFAICLGHQLLSIAHGHETYKLKFGHHGGNHPVKNTETNLVEITAQNHNYSVPDSITDIATITHVNLFDNTIEGVAYNNKPIFSVQFHPESSPGPHESKYLFKQFADACR